MIYAYARVSSKDQNLERQLNAFQNCGIAIDKILWDKESGADFDRTNYKKLIRKLRYDDLLIIKSIDRLGRNYECILCEWKRITKDIGANIYVLDMPLLDTRCHEKNLIGKLIADIVLQLLSFVAENERTNIRTRQAEGIAIAKQKGVRFGRPRIILPDNFYEVADAYITHTISYNEALNLTNLRPTTFYRYLKGYNITEPQDDKENYFWSNIVDVLDEDKQCELNGKIPKTLNRKLRHFTFLDTYYKAIKLMTETESGQYVKAICGYMFDGTERKLKPPVDAYFALAKRKLSLAWTRKKVGAMGGKTDKSTPSVTLEKIKTDFGLTGDIFNKD